MIFFMPKNLAHDFCDATAKMDAAHAHEFLEHEHFRGKIVFAVREQKG